MFVINDNVSLELHAARLPAIERIYCESFPDDNEREEMADILSRIGAGGPPPLPNTFMIVAGDEAGHADGLLVVDWYRASRVAHLTYLAVDRACRQRGIARALITDALPRSLANIEQREGFTFTAIVLEVHKPWIGRDDVFDPDTRMGIFAGLGAKWVPIHYVQPCLPQRREGAQDLLLMALPAGNLPQDEMPAQCLVDFLAEFFRGLGIPDPEERQPYRDMVAQVRAATCSNGMIPLRHAPRMEKPRLHFTNACIALQFVEDSGSADNNPSPEFCPQVHSFETDLLSYQSQVSPPFWTWMLDDHPSTVSVEFPETYEYTSEGATRTLASARKSVELNVQVLKTSFRRSGCNGWHIVLSTQASGHLSEYEIIKLASYFGSLQEDTRLKDLMSFLPRGSGKALSAGDLARSLCGIPQGHDLFLKTGIVDINTAHSRFASDGTRGEFEWPVFYRHLIAAGSGINDGHDQMLALYCGDEDFRYACNAFCGLSLGIFDFRRMNFNEVTDTLQPRLANPGYFLVLNRGSILCSRHDLDATASGRMAMSPYLLIPNMLLAHNEFIASRAESRIDSIIDECQGSEKSINLVMRSAEFDLNVAYLQNVFHYPSERFIYDFGSAHRGILERMESARKKSGNVDKILEARKSLRDGKRDLALTILLAVISCMELASIFESASSSDHMMAVGYALALATLVAVSIFFLKKDHGR